MAIDNNQIKKKKWYLHWAFILSVILFIALIWVYADRQSKIKNLEKEHQNQISQVKENFSEFTDSTRKSHFMLMAKPLSWLVRKELLNENLNPVNKYFNILVKEKQFQEIFLTDPQGKIKLCTNKKYEGKRFSKFYREDYREVKETKSWQDNDKLLIASPVFGYEKRLGTLFIKIKPEQFQTSEL